MQDNNHFFNGKLRTHYFRLAYNFNSIEVYVNFTLFLINFNDKHIMSFSLYL